MSEFTVVTAAIEEMSGRLGGISPGTRELHAQTGTHATAGANTPADAAVSGMMARWATALPQFAEAGDRLQAAMRGAASTYGATDTAVAEAARAGDERP